MLDFQRQEALRSINWNYFHEDPLHSNALVALECWQYDAITKPIEGRNFRVVRLADGKGASESYRDVVEERLKRWLNCEDLYQPPRPPENSGRLKGGLRIAMCNRPTNRPAMTISRQAFEVIEKFFSLHAITLPSFLNNRGVHSKFIEKEPKSHRIKRIHIIIKAIQKLEIANYLLSLTHDVATGWTTAFICGDRVLPEREGDSDYGSIFEQLFSTVILSHDFWSNPLFLPCTLLQNYAFRARIRMDITHIEVNSIDARFSVNQNNPYIRGRCVPQNWPQNVDTRLMATKLSSIAPQISFMISCCNWLRGCKSFLQDTERALSNDDALKSCHYNLYKLREILALLQSEIENLSSFFAMCRERIEFQTNLLYSIISQQDSFVNRQDNILNLLIARSSKQDSIFMSTFTFITALFLPGTFIATLFSMTMFEWQPGSDSSGNNTPTTSLSSYISDKFWIFWAVAAPLTLVTMLGWFSWFKYADHRWRKELAQTLQSVQARGANEYFLSMLAENAGSGKANRYALNTE